jgi:NAD(P)-dependent dehydrogenase (short-subunit alcohol dehydrogenase family)
MSKIDIPTICVPCAGITRDALAVKLDKETKKATLYDSDNFRLILEVNLMAPTYWGMELVARIAERHGRWTPGSELRGSVVLIGSVSSQGNKGQVAYAASKRALEAVAATLTSEAMFYGVRFGVVHPGYTNTPMVQKMGQELIEKLVLPNTQLKRLVATDEVADAICFMVENPAVNREVWVDAGWHVAP